MKIGCLKVPKPSYPPYFDQLSERQKPLYTRYLLVEVPNPLPQASEAGWGARLAISYHRHGVVQLPEIVWMDGWIYNRVILTLKRVGEVAEKMCGGGKRRNMGKQWEESSGTEEPGWKVIKCAREPLAV